MTIWAFEPNVYVGMQSPAAGIRLGPFWDSRPVVRQVRLKKTWAIDHALSASAIEEQERSEDELKAHAID